MRGRGRGPPRRKPPADARLTQRTSTMPTVPSFQMASCSYKLFRPAMGLPVRTTAYGPRFTLGYNLAGTWSAVAPRPEWLRLEDSAFFEVYFRHLDELGIDRVLAGAQRI